MDGVEGVSRQPIAPGESFVYDFVAEPAGTHWYHSHVGVQYGNGLFGAFVVEEASPIASYDRDEVLLINDWFHESGDALLAGLLKPPPMVDMPATKGAGAEGRHAGHEEDGRYGRPARDGDAHEGRRGRPIPVGARQRQGPAPGTKGPLTTIGVGDGETIRLRLINGSSTYAFRYQVDGHPLTVIASDGSPMKPVVVDNLVFAGRALRRAPQGAGAWRPLDPCGDARRQRGSCHPSVPWGGRAEPEATPVRWGSVP